MALIRPHLTAVSQSKLNDLIGQLSHDLRSPVRAMIEVADWIQEDLRESGHSNPEQMSENMALLSERGARLRTLVSELCVFDQTGTCTDWFDGNWEPLKKRLCTEVPHLDGFKLNVVTDCSVDMAEQDLYVLMHRLVDNAVRHHHASNGRIDVMVRPTDEWVELTVIDDGPGIPQDRRAALVAPFAKSYPHSVGHTHGMGLAIVARIVAHYSGQLAIEDARGQSGCSVRIRTPNFRKH